MWLHLQKDILEDFEEVQHRYTDRVFDWKANGLYVFDAEARAEEERERKRSPWNRRMSRKRAKAARARGLAESPVTYRAVERARRRRAYRKQKARKEHAVKEERA